MDFQKEVIDKSQDIPILVDFWAPWCGPCQYLGPVLEKLDAQANGKWQLVKVNTDENQSISQEYGIQGIPAVKLFHKGKVIAEFTGALSESQVKAFLDDNLPGESKDAFEELKKMINWPSDSAVVEKLESFVQLNNEVEEARLALAAEKIFTDPEQVESLINEFGLGHKFEEKANAIMTLLELVNYEPIDSEGNAGKKLFEAQKELRNCELEKCLSLCVEAVMINKSVRGELPRRACIAFFQLLGHDHELSEKYEKRFQMALY